MIRHARGCRSRTALAARVARRFKRRSGRHGNRRRSARRSRNSARRARGDTRARPRSAKGSSAHPHKQRSTTRPSSGSQTPRQGVVRTRSGEAYKPSAVRAYRQALDHRTLPRLGSKRLTAISHTTLQDFADQLSAQGLSASSVRNTILPFRAIFRRAHRRGEVADQPHLNLALPAVRGSRDRVAAPTELAPLLDALQPDDRAIYATALYAGLRAGELQALQWTDIDLNANLIHVTRNWDRQHGFIAPKSRSGTRRVPITPTLRRELLAPPPPPRHRRNQDSSSQATATPTNHSTQAASPSTPAKPGTTPASPRSASTNAATATPPT